MNRKLRTLAIPMLLAVACAGDSTGPGTTGTSGGSGNPPSGGGPSDPEVSSFVASMNAHRESVGCAELDWHGPTGDVAQAHSADMQQRDFFSHTNPDGQDPFDRLAAAGVTWVGGAGENIALTQGGAESALDLWLNSSGHRENIERCGYTHHGVGLAQGYWTHVFITDPSP